MNEPPHRTAFLNVQVFSSHRQSLMKHKKDTGPRMWIKQSESTHCPTAQKKPSRLKSPLLSRLLSLSLSHSLCPSLPPSLPNSQWQWLNRPVLCCEGLPCLILYVAGHSVSGCCVNTASPWCGGSGGRAQGPGVMESPSPWEQWAFRM